MLPKSRRVVADRDFKSIYKKGKRRSTENLNLVFLKTNQSVTRFGFVVSKKQAQRIVDRNRIKRRLRSCVASLLPDVKGSYDVVIGGRRSLLESNTEELSQEIRKLLERASLLKKL